MKRRLYRNIRIRWLNIRSNFPVAIIWMRRRDTWNLDEFAERCLIRVAKRHMKQDGWDRMEWLREKRFSGDFLTRISCNHEYRVLQLIDTALKIIETSEKDWMTGYGPYEKALDVLWKRRGVMWN